MVAIKIAKRKSSERKLILDLAKEDAKPNLKKSKSITLHSGLFTK